MFSLSSHQAKYSWLFPPASLNIPSTWRPTLPVLTISTCCRWMRHHIMDIWHRKSSGIRKIIIIEHGEVFLMKDASHISIKETGEKALYVCMQGMKKIKMNYEPEGLVNEWQKALIVWKCSVLHQCLILESTNHTECPPKLKYE